MQILGSCSNFVAAFGSLCAHLPVIVVDLYGTELDNKLQTVRDVWRAEIYLKLLKIMGIIKTQIKWNKKEWNNGKEVWIENGLEKKFGLKTVWMEWVIL